MRKLVLVWTVVPTCLSPESPKPAFKQIREIGSSVPNHKSVTSFCISGFCLVSSGDGLHSGLGSPVRLLVIKQPCLYLLFEKTKAQTDILSFCGSGQLWNIHNNNNLSFHPAAQSHAFSVCCRVLPVYASFLPLSHVVVRQMI